MMGYKLFIHPTCPASKELVLSLKGRKLLDRIHVLLLDTPIPVNSRVFPWSVPLLVDREGYPVAMDPISIEEVEAYLNGESYEAGGDLELLEKSILHSAYASALTLTHRSIRPLIQESFLYPALRLKIRGIRFEEAKTIIENTAEEFYKRVKEKIARALSIAVVRYYYYSGIRSWERIAAVERGDVAAAVLAMASIGRVGFPVTPVEPDMVGFMAGFIRRGAKGLLRKIEREYRETLMDDEYIGLIKEIIG